MLWNPNPFLNELIFLNMQEFVKPLVKNSTVKNNCYSRHKKLLISTYQKTVSVPCQGL